MLPPPEGNDMTSAEAGIGVRAGVLPPQKMDLEVGSKYILSCLGVYNYILDIMYIFIVNPRVL